MTLSQHDIHREPNGSNTNISNEENPTEESLEKDSCKCWEPCQWWTSALVTLKALYPPPHTLTMERVPGTECGQCSAISLHPAGRVVFQNEGRRRIGRNGMGCGQDHRICDQWLRSQSVVRRAMQGPFQRLYFVRFRFECVRRVNELPILFRQKAKVAYNPKKHQNRNLPPVGKRNRKHKYTIVCKWKNYSP